MSADAGMAWERRDRLGGTHLPTSGTWYAGHQKKYTLQIFITIFCLFFDLSVQNLGQKIRFCQNVETAP